MLQHPSAGVMNAVNRQTNDTELVDYFAVDELFAALVLCQMIPVTCSCGIHQLSGIKCVSYSLLLAVNKKVMWEADVCGCVVPHLRLPLDQRTQYYIALTYRYLCFGQAKQKYFTIQVVSGVCRGLPKHGLLKLSGYTW